MKGLLINKVNDIVIADKVKIYRDFFHKTKGLMFSRPLRKGEAIILVADNEGVMETTIHMLFVFFSIDVVWLNEKKEVVDKKKGIKMFSPLIVPSKPAKYVVELRKGASRHTFIGDKLEFDDK